MDEMFDLSRLSPGRESAGGGPDSGRPCVELSLPLFKRCKPHLPLTALPPLTNGLETHCTSVREREREGERER